MRDRSSATVRRLQVRSLGALFAVGALGLAACTSEAAAPSAPAAVTPTATAQFVSPSALAGAGSPTSESAAASTATASPSAAAPTSVDSTPTSTPDDATPQSPTPLGSVLPEVVKPTDPQEIADRQAVEAAWIRFWDYYPTFEELSPAERVEIAEVISVDPLKADIIRGAANADANGRTGYGTVTHRISWFQNVGGGTVTVMADCMDQSTAGSMDRATGKKLSKGYPRENLRGELIFDEGAGWRVRNLYYLTDEEC